MFIGGILRTGDGLQPDHRPAERRAERLALGIGERRLARLANGPRLLGRARRRRLLDQRIDDREEVAPAAPVRLAVALDEPGALRDFPGEAGVALRRLGDERQPPL